jgi:hypothetical protein
VWVSSRSVKPSGDNDERVAPWRAVDLSEQDRACVLSDPAFEDEWRDSLALQPRRERVVVLLPLAEN